MKKFALLAILVLVSASAAVGGGPKTEADGPVVMSGALFDSGTPFVSPAADGTDNIYLVNRTFTDEAGVVHFDYAYAALRAADMLNPGIYERYLQTQLAAKVLGPRTGEDMDHAARVHDSALAASGFRGYLQQLEAWIPRDLLQRLAEPGTAQSPEALTADVRALGIPVAEFDWFDPDWEYSTLADLPNATIDCEICPPTGVPAPVCYGSCVKSCSGSPKNCYVEKVKLQ